MKSEKVLDYALFQLSPKRSKCDLFVSSDGNTEKLASGLVKPFVTHLRVVEEQLASAVQSIKLEVDKHRKFESWFTKGTLERFVLFVCTPDVLEVCTTYDSEMSQLEAALKIYSQGTDSELSAPFGGNGMRSQEVADSTKKELLRAIDVRLHSLKQDLTTACVRADSAGFNYQSVLELQMFSDYFGALRLNESCAKFLSLCGKRPEIFSRSCNTRVDDCALRSSYGSDMSIDDSPVFISRPEIHSQYKSQVPNDEYTASKFQQLNTLPNQYPMGEERKENNVGMESSLQNSQQPSRRLSVQDRINMFENKQKENSGSGSGSGPSGKTIIGKSIELPRHASDELTSSVSSSAGEKAVLRRWSAASSDMSIDLSNDSKDMETPFCTPPSSFASQGKSAMSDSKDPKDLTHRDLSGNGREVVMKASGDALVSSLDADAKDANFINQTVFQNQFIPSAARTEKSVSVKQSLTQDNVMALSEDQESGRVINQVTCKAQFTRNEKKNQAVAQQALTGTYSNKLGEIGQTPLRSPTVIMTHSPELHSPSRTIQSEGGNGSEVWEGFLNRYKGDGSLDLKDESRFERRELWSSEKKHGKFANEIEDLGKQTSKFMGAGFGPQQAKKSQIRREGSNAVSGNGTQKFPGKVISEIRETTGSNSSVSVEQNQSKRGRQGNQELNDMLQFKANELEKLFAVHKTRVSSDPLIHGQRSKLPDVVTNQSAFSPSRKLVAATSASPLHDAHKGVESCGYSTPVAMLNPCLGLNSTSNEEYGANFQFSNSSRGKFYDKYRQKRDAKLKEEWSSRGAEKEAKMKAMLDCLERSTAEMRATFSGSAERQHSLLHRPVQKLRPFNNGSTMKGEKVVDYLGSEVDEDISSELSEHKPYGQNGLLSEASLGEVVSKCTQSKKHTPNRNFSSPISHASVVPVPRSSVRASKQRGQLENPNTQSVSNFSNLRKENTRPASSKTTPRSQMRNHATAEDDRPQHSHSLKKTSSPVELKQLFASTLSESLKLEETTAKLHFEDAQQEFDTLPVEDSIVRKSEKSRVSHDYDDSPGEESPVSWNSGSINRSFVHPQSSDFEVSVDSPMGSPASWNSHSLSQSEAEVSAARTRKKWGGAHKPVTVLSSSQNQPRKDVTKGFKRLLKFGRKSNRGNELVDCISATTSEGDDDLEDGRFGSANNGSAEDLRKARMGPHPHPSEHGFIDSDHFNEHVQALRSSIPAPPTNFKMREDHLSGSSLKAPRSFFSLSTFRNKGSDSRTR